MHLSELPAADQKEILEALDLFGLNEKERRTYLAILPLGTVTLTPLAKATGLPLTTVQAVVGRLAEHGLIKVGQRGSRHFYEPLEPIALRRILERRAEEMAGAIPLLERLKATPTGRAKLRVFQGERVADILHLALKSKDKLVHEIVAAKDFQDIIGEKFHFTRRRVRQGVHLKSLRVESREIKRYSADTHRRELREAKFLPRELTFMANVMFWDDTVACFAAPEEKLAWVVESPSYAEMWRQLFGTMWEISRKMVTA
jgi:sugar-specific transcriptional regulator TrmB